MRQQIIMNRTPSLVTFVVIVACSGILKGCIVGVESQAIGSTNDTIGAAYAYFSLDDTFNTTNNDAIFKCRDDGARCVFQRGDYADYDFGEGQETENIQGATWAATDSSVAELRLSTCVVTDDTQTQTRSAESPNCLVVCNANCTCTFENGTSCTKLDEAPVDVDIVRTEPPEKDAFTTCPQIKNVVHCPALMNSNESLPAGNEDNYDCFNFCGGIFISSCDLSDGSCGKLNCTNATADGTVTGIVLGCTKADISNTSDTTDNTDNTTDSSSFPSAAFAMKWLFVVSAAGIAFWL